MLLFRVKKHSRRRFAAQAVGFRSMGAEKNILDAAALEGNLPDKIFMHFIQIRRFNQLPADTALVGDDDNLKSGPGKFADGLNTFWNKKKFFPMFDVIGRILVDDPVPI